MPPPPLRLDHVAFPVLDAERSFRFYSEVLGLPLVSSLEGDDWHGRPWLMMMFALGDDREIVLVARRGAPRPMDDGVPKDMRHLAFAVATLEEQAAWHRRVQEHGIEVRVEDHGTQHSIYFDDPDGTVLEITTPPSEMVMTRDPKAEAVVRAWLAPTGSSKGEST
jgi:catechol 2,3-dioxygenase-like lactoylglutathione lyase family enzyme